MSPQVKVMVARFPHGAAEHPDVSDYLIRTVCEMKTDPRISEVLMYRRDDTPITMSRNHCLGAAQENGADFLLMLDSDMSPDSHLSTNQYAHRRDPLAVPFWESSFTFLHNRRAKKLPPALVVAPYCGPPPIENVYVFQWTNPETSLPDDMPRYALSQFTREEAARMRGITEVAAGPTGLILIDMQMIEKLEQPYTYYEWDTPEEKAKGSTEDVTFTRDLSLQGYPTFCNWDAWAGHWKMKCVLKPEVLTPADVGRKLKRAVLSELGVDLDTGEFKVKVGSNGELRPIKSEVRLAVNSQEQSQRESSLAGRRN